MARTNTRILIFAFFASLLLHTFVIVALDFRVERPPQALRTLDIRLVAPSSPANPPSEILGAEQPNTQGHPQVEDSITEITPIPVTTEKFDDGVTLRDEVEVPQENTARAVQSIPESLDSSPAPESVLESNTITTPNPEVSIHDLVTAAAAIAAEQTNNQRVRNVTTTDDVANTEEEYYLKAWLKKVQEVGQLNYPQEAVEQKLYGKLRLYVAINPDGSVQETRVLRSSGHAVLDEAAENIVSLAEPFSAFPQSMRESIDLLEVVREWEFRKEALVPVTNSEDE